MPRSRTIRIAYALLSLARGLLSLAGAVLMTIAVFLLLPYLQQVSEPDKKDMEIRTVDSANLPPPPPPPPEEKQEEEEKEEEPPPDMAAEAQPLDLSQLELALNPGIGGAGGGGGFDVQSLKSMASKMNEESDAIFSMADLDQAPRPIYQAAPEYPPELRKKNIQGTVYLIFVVDKYGNVQNPKVEKASHPAFATPAMTAIRRWRFEPGKRNGSPVNFKMRVPISFMK